MKEPDKTAVPYKYKEDRKRNDFLNKRDKREHNGKLPGNYPKDEDIMNRRDIEREGQQGEEFSRGLRHGKPEGNEGPVVTDSSQSNKPPVPGNIEDVEEQKGEDMERPIPKNLDIDNEKLNEDQEENESDVTKEDLQALGPKDLSNDMDVDDKLRRKRVWPVDMAAKDLDIPKGDESDDDVGESIGPRDEENDFYSLGGDRHEDDVEGK